MVTRLEATKKWQRENRERYLTLRRAARARRLAAREPQPFQCVLCPVSLPTVIGRGIHEARMHPGFVPEHRLERERELRQKRHRTEEYRARHREWARGNPKVRARFAVWQAVKDGTLTRTPCIVCGATPVHGHHHNGYDRPLDVQWLCRPHHLAAHRETVAA